MSQSAIVYAWVGVEDAQLEYIISWWVQREPWVISIRVSSPQICFHSIIVSHRQLFPEETPALEESDPPHSGQVKLMIGTTRPSRPPTTGYQNICNQSACSLPAPIKTEDGSVRQRALYAVNLYFLPRACWGIHVGMYIAGYLACRTPAESLYPEITLWLNPLTPLLMGQNVNKVVRTLSTPTSLINKVYDSR